ncbi:MAG: hypothetical protein AB1717_08040 [Pseudomonadota bacterium]
MILYLGECFEAEADLIPLVLSIEAISIAYVYLRFGVTHPQFDDAPHMVDALSSFGEGRVFIEKSFGAIGAQDIFRLLSCETEEINLKSCDGRVERADMVFHETSVRGIDLFISWLSGRAGARASPEILASWIERLRILVSGRDSQGFSLSQHKPFLLSKSTLDALELKGIGPAQVFWRMSKDLEVAGALEEALILVRHAVNLRPDLPKFKESEIGIKQKILSLS